MDRILTDNQENTDKNVQDQKTLSAKKANDAEMKDESQANKSQTYKNGHSKKQTLFDQSDDDDDDQIMESDEFGKLHREFCKKTIKDVQDERNSIFNFLDEMKADMVTQKQKIKKQQEKLQKLQNEKKDTKKQEELTKKQTNVCLNKNLQKAEQTFKNVVNSNKQYFESIASFGQAIEDGVTVESHEIEQPFYPSREEDDQNEAANYCELDDGVVQEILIDHLQKEGMKESVDLMKQESKFDKQPSNQLEESLQKFKSYQDQFNELNEIIQDLKNRKTESALRWATQNQRQLQANNGQNFIFMLHQINYRSMLQKAVDIHFDLNYKHLCNSPTDLKVLDNEISSPNNVPHQTKKFKDDDKVALKLKLGTKVKSEDIADFFRDQKFIEKSYIHSTTEDGQKNGLGAILLEDQEQAEQTAKELDGNYIGDYYVEITVISYGDYIKFNGSSDNGSIVKTEGNQNPLSQLQEFKSSLLDDSEQQKILDRHQIDSGNAAIVPEKRQVYVQRDYDNACVQILNYIQVNLSQYLMSRSMPGYGMNGNHVDQNAHIQMEEQNKIQKMMGALIFIPKYSELRLKNNNVKNGSSNFQPPPDDASAQYFDLFNEEQTEKLWAELILRVNDLYCKVHRLSQQSSLYMTLVASSYSLPLYQFAQKKFMKTVAGKTKTSGGAFSASNLKSKEMPCEVSLGQDFSFHNIFICPVSKETSGQPMLLKCGHVISKQSVNKLSRNNPKTTIRCPTCPQEMTPENGVSIINY